MANRRATASPSVTSLSNEFWGFERDGFEARAKELGVEYKTFDVTDEPSITEQLDEAKSAAN